MQHLRVASIVVLVAVALPAGATRGPGRRSSPPPPTVATASIDRWFCFSSPRRDLSLRLPDRPHRGLRVTPTLIGEVKTDVWTARAGDTTFTVTHTHLPMVATLLFRRQSLYTKASDQMLVEVGARAIRAGAAHDALFEHELRYTIAARQGEPTRIGRARFVLRDDDTMVVVNAVVPAGKLALLEHFFDHVRPHCEPRA